VSEKWRDARDTAAGRFLAAWRKDPPDERAARIRTEGGRILATWRGRASLERDALWSAACWAQSALDALRAHGLYAAEEDLAVAAATLQIGVQQRRGAA
jgi:hypothetical protein